MPKYRFLPHATLAIFALASSAGASATTADDTVDPTHLMAAYHAAVIGHDASRLENLFLPAETAWFSVTSDRALAAARVTKPATPKLRPGSVAGFLKMVADPKVQLDPEHKHLRIVSDGDIAAVTFNFRFLINGEEENRGAESWQLVHTSDGWRIASIVFSSTPTTLPR